MRWLLITTINRNPGDDFTRIGIERAICEVDPSAQFRLMDKHRAGLYVPRDTDRAVVCGMPLFWADGENKCYTEGWWGWLVELARAVPTALCGVGSFASPSRVSDIGFDELRQHADELIEACSSRIILRDAMANRMLGKSYPIAPCPSVMAAIPECFALERGMMMKLPEGWKISAIATDIVNIMPAGSHYERYAPDEAECWRSIQRELSDTLMERGFTFAAHSDIEHEHALSLGWPRERIVAYCGDPQLMLDLYRSCRTYVGNRVHGAVVARSVGADSLLIGYDSRLGMARLIGVDAIYPSEFTPDRVDKIACATDPRLVVAETRAAMRAFFEGYASW